MRYNYSREISKIVNDFSFLLGFNYSPDKIMYGMRAYPSLSFIKRLSEFKWLEFHIVGSDYGTEESMPPYHFFLCKYYKICGIMICFRTLDIPFNNRPYDYVPTSSSNYLGTISSLIKKNETIVEILKNGWENNTHLI